MIDQLLSFLTSLPLHWLVLTGSFLEEVIAPIPSPFVMTTASLAGMEKGYSFFDFLLIATIGAVGKTVASLVLYFVADKTEDVFASKIGRISGINHRQIEQLGTLLNNGWWDDLILLLLRSMPFIPSILISLGAGVIKINLKTYIVTTFLGSVVRNGIFLLIGIYGLEQLLSLWKSNSWLLFAALVGGLLVLLVGYLVFKDRLSALVLNFKNPVLPKKSRK